MPTQYEIVFWIILFMAGVVVGRISMAIQYAFMKKEAMRIKQSESKKR